MTLTVIQISPSFLMQMKTKTATQIVNQTSYVPHTISNLQNLEDHHDSIPGPFELQDHTTIDNNQPAPAKPIPGPSAQINQKMATFQHYMYQTIHLQHHHFIKTIQDINSSRSNLATKEANTTRPFLIPL